ncbi:hypothetical protein [Tenacibaculum aiptasiae]|uniref:LPD3 domain-containing protein n=1 Tax=Tenacibaculum aiptasiae TaxID=426481 RepID=UPI00232ECCF7|nr:hypothetical protein [Tenacibaculum aiptasiae]
MLESLIQQYNELDNTKVTRVFLESFLNKLSVVKNTTEETSFMYGKIKNILEQFSNQEFFIELSSKIKKGTSISKLQAPSEISSLKDFKINTEQWAKDKLIGSKFYHKGIKETIYFSNSGVLKGIQKSNSWAKSKLIYRIFNILKKSKLQEFKKLKGSSGVYKLTSQIKIDSVNYDVIITLRKGSNGVVYYDHKLTRIKKIITKDEGLKAPEIVVDLSPAKEVFITLPPKKETFVATESNKSATNLQQNEFKEGAPQTLINTGFSPTVATESNKSATNLQQNTNKIATKLQQNLEPATKLQQSATKEQQLLQEPKKVVAKENKKVLSTSDINNMTFDTLPFTGEWASFMQNPAKTMKLAVWGKPKNGKTAGSTKLANYLTNFGPILYVFADQGINKSTQDLWKLSGLSEKSNAYLSDTVDLKELDRLCASGEYSFIFIDLINTFIYKTGIKHHEFRERFIKKYPNISFILIFEVTKSGNFKGDQGWTHIPDALITVESFVMHNQGRYGVGDFVVWPEGLKKVNPKKYKEYFSEEEEKEIILEL